MAEKTINEENEIIVPTFSEPKWYVLHTIAGYENIAKNNLELVVSKFHLEERIFNIIIPIEEKIVEKKGKLIIEEEKLMPTYLFVKMIYGDDIWHNITRTRGITGFVGPKGRPLPLTTKEIETLQLEEKISLQQPTLNLNDTVEIISGDYKTTIGIVESINPDTKKCVIKVLGESVSLNLELDIDQLRRVNVANKE